MEARGRARDGAGSSRLAPPVGCSRVKPLPVALLVTAAMPLASSTGLQGGSEPHDDASCGRPAVLCAPDLDFDDAI